MKMDPRLSSGWGLNAWVVREGLSEEIAINGPAKTLQLKGKRMLGVPMP